MTSTLYERDGSFLFELVRVVFEVERMADEEDDRFSIDCERKRSWGGREDMWRGCTSRLAGGRLKVCDRLGTGRCGFPSGSS